MVHARGDALKVLSISLPDWKGHLLNTHQDIKKKKKIKTKKTTLEMKDEHLL